MKLVCSNTSAQRNRSTTSTPPGTNGVSINFGNDEHQCTRTKRKRTDDHNGEEMCEAETSSNHVLLSGPVIEKRRNRSQLQKSLSLQWACYARTRRTPPRLRTAYEAGNEGHRLPEPLLFANYERRLFWRKKKSYREQSDWTLLTEGPVLRQHCSFLPSAPQEEPGAIMYFRASVKAYSAEEKTRK